MSEHQENSELADAKKQLEDHPNDLALRFQLGKCLSEAGRHKEAIAELQKARQHQEHRKEAIELLEKSYEARGLPNLSMQINEEDTQ